MQDTAAHPGLSSPCRILSRASRSLKLCPGDSLWLPGPSQTTSELLPPPLLLGPGPTHHMPPAQGLWSQDDWHQTSSTTSKQNPSLPPHEMGTNIFPLNMSSQAGQGRNPGLQGLPHKTHRLDLQPQRGAVSQFWALEAWDQQACKVGSF